MALQNNIQFNDLRCGPLRPVPPKGDPESRCCFPAFGTFAHVQTAEPKDNINTPPAFPFFLTVPARLVIQVSTPTDSFYSTSTRKGLSGFFPCLAPAALAPLSSQSTQRFCVSSIPFPAYLTTQPCQKCAITLKS